MWIHPYPFIILRIRRDKTREKIMVIVIAGSYTQPYTSFQVQSLWSGKEERVRAEILRRSRFHKLFPSRSDGDHSRDAASESPPESKQHGRSDYFKHAFCKNRNKCHLWCVTRCFEGWTVMILQHVNVTNVANCASYDNSNDIYIHTCNSRVLKTKQMLHGTLMIVTPCKL